MKDIIQILVRNTVLILLSMAATKGLVPANLITDSNVAEIVNTLLLIGGALCIMVWSWWQNRKNLLTPPPPQNSPAPSSSAGLPPPVAAFILLLGAGVFLSLTACSTPQQQAVTNVAAAAGKAVVESPFTWQALGAASAWAEINYINPENKIGTALDVQTTASALYTVLDGRTITQDRVKQATDAYKSGSNSELYSQIAAFLGNAFVAQVQKWQAAGDTDWLDRAKYYILGQQLAATALSGSN